MVTTESFVDTASQWKFPLVEDHKDGFGMHDKVDENFDINNNDIHLVPVDGDCLEDIDISYSTLVKEGLRTAIASRRLSKGLPEVTPEYAAPKPDQPTDEDLERSRIRRERNKVAAEKCRKKRREKEKLIVQEHSELEKRNKELLKEVANLKRERESLVLLLQTHQAICKRDTQIQNKGSQNT